MVRQYRRLKLFPTLALSMPPTPLAEKGDRSFDRPRGLQRCRHQIPIHTLYLTITATRSPGYGKLENESRVLPLLEVSPTTADAYGTAHLITPYSATSSQLTLPSVFKLSARRTPTGRLTVLPGGGVTADVCWKSDEVVGAVTRFSRTYCNRSTNVVDEIRRCLLSEVGGVRPR